MISAAGGGPAPIGRERILDALQAALEAREEGLLRFIGITSHSLHAPVIHRMALERFDFDSVLLPYSYIMLQNPQYAADVNALLAVLVLLASAGIATLV